MNLGNLLSPDEILPAMRATDRAGAIAELVEVLVQRGHLAAADRATIIAALLQREGTASTAMGFGIALPHTFSDRVSRRVMVFGWSDAGIEYSSLDGAPVHFVVLWVMPKTEFQAQLHTLSTIAKFLNDHTVRARLASARNTVEILRDLFPGNAS